MKLRAWRNYDRTKRGRNSRRETSCANWRLYIWNCENSNARIGTPDLRYRSDDITLVRANVTHKKSEPNKMHEWYERGKRPRQHTRAHHTTAWDWTLLRTYLPPHQPPVPRDHPHSAVQGAGRRVTRLYSPNTNQKAASRFYVHIYKFIRVFMTRYI